MAPGGLVGDYRRLNTQTVPDRYPLPNIADFSAMLHISKVFTKLDLTKGYYQVPYLLQTFLILQWSRLSGCLIGWGCHLASGTMDVPSINWWIRFSSAFCTVLYMWMMSSYTLFLILNMCKVSLISSPSMNSASTLFYAWLQLLRLNNLVWKYQDQVAFHYSNTHRSSPPFPRPSDKRGLQHFLGILRFSTKCSSRWCQPPAARSSQLLGSSGVLLQEVICPRNQILRLWLWDVCSQLLSPQISVSC